MPKRGRPSATEIKTIRDNARKKTPAEIAIMLDRTEDFIISVMKEEENYEEAQEIIADFRNRPEYNQIKRQFAEDEMAIFEHKYVELTLQFKNDIKPSERSQIVLAVTYELLISKTLIQRKQMEDSIIAWQLEIEEVRNDDSLDEEKVKKPRIAKLHELITNTRAALTRVVANVNDYMDKWQKQIRDIKGTRDQIRKNEEGAKKEVVELLRAFDNESFRKHEGEEMELMRMAGERELKRLAKPHKYMDGLVDQPILCSKTIQMLEEEEGDGE
jgi:hypothetical protein